MAAPVYPPPAIALPELVIGRAEQVAVAGHRLIQGPDGMHVAIIKKLAKALMGYVYVVAPAKRVPTDAMIEIHPTQKFAMKMIKKECIREGRTLDGSAVMEDPIMELRVMHYLSMPDPHPGRQYVLKLFHVWEDPLWIYAIMEFADGGDLFEHVSGSVLPDGTTRLPEDVAKRYMTQLLMGTDYMHKKHISHRDMSLENSMLVAGEIRIIDFGLAAIMPVGGGPMKPQRGVGKPGVMPPEMFRGLEYHGPSVDMWCLGNMLFVMLYGAPPYRVPDEKSCQLFRYVIRGKIAKLVQSWRMTAYASREALGLIEALLVPPIRRTAEDVLNTNPWIRPPGSPALIPPPGPATPGPPGGVGGGGGGGGGGEAAGK